MILHLPKQTSVWLSEPGITLVIITKLFLLRQSKSNSHGGKVVFKLSIWPNLLHRVYPEDHHYLLRIFFFFWKCGLSGRSPVLLNQSALEWIPQEICVHTEVWEVLSKGSTWYVIVSGLMCCLHTINNNNNNSNNRFLVSE